MVVTSEFFVLMFLVFLVGGFVGYRAGRRSTRTEPLTPEELR